MLENFQEQCVSEASGQGQSHEPTVKSARDTQVSPSKAAKKQRCGHKISHAVPDHIVVRVELFLDVLCR